MTQDKHMAKPEKPLLARLLQAWLICLVVFPALLMLVYTIPDSLVQENVITSARVLVEEGAWPQLVKDTYWSQLDNYTESYVLNMAVHQDGNPIISAILNPYYENAQIETNTSVNRLLSVEEGVGQKANTSYGRYWQGHLVLERPLLVFLTLKQIYIVLAVILLVLLVLACRALTKRTGWVFAGLLVVSLLLVHGWLLPISTKFWFSFAVALAAVTIVGSMDDETIFSNTAPLIFFYFGAVTVYLDYMSTPIVALGAPFISAVLIERKTLSTMRASEAFLWAEKLILCWLAGWLLLGASNWIIYVLVSPSHADALQGLVERTSNWAGASGLAERGFTRATGIISVVQTWIPRPKVRRYIFIAGVALSVLAALPKGQNAYARRLLVLVSLVPFLWWAVMSRSVTAHAWAVYRTIMVNIFALLCELRLLVEDLRSWAVSSHRV